jgi:transcription initiation factor TFIID subunit 11
MRCPNRLSGRCVVPAFILIAVVKLSQVVQQGLGHQVSTPVAQIVAGFSKVFVGEIVEKGQFVALYSLCLKSNPSGPKARAVQARRGETGPLAPDHLREAYHAYQIEAGRVGAARPLKSKHLFRR